ncbi:MULTISPECIES: hypothetical protein [Ramlibacter]|uniref:Uncharacterized protein n=1 Tax=Ramlibacter aquaticus TaxID=2780094 RepID=A0ABR9SIF6_9BURK|nr:MULTISPECIES: hypothetical protein [Ramlibacter]MBE7941689.1 hypothetical protein [Ramlibacter aquaticus]
MVILLLPVPQYRQSVTPTADCESAGLMFAFGFAPTGNPIDVTGQGFSLPGVLVSALRDAATCGVYSHLAVFLAGAANAPGVWPVLQACIDSLRGDPSAASLVISGILTADQRRWLESVGCRVFAEPVRAIEALA